MASLLPEIPLELMNPRQKYALINYLVGLGLPSRITRQVLEQWGAALFVDVTAGDYELLNAHLRTSPGPNAPVAGAGS